MFTRDRTFARLMEALAEMNCQSYRGRTRRAVREPSPSSFSTKPRALCTGVCTTIPGTTTDLPQNAGVTGSTYGLQVINTYGSAGANADLNYGGPCPMSANLRPNSSGRRVIRQQWHAILSQLAVLPTNQPSGLEWPVPEVKTLTDFGPLPRSPVTGTTRVPDNGLSP